MLNLILFIIIGLGITNLVVNATVLDNPRDYIINFSQNYRYFKWISSLITCMMCSGFWVGFFMSLDSSISITSPIYGGAIISVCSYIFGSMMDYLDLSIAIKGNKLGTENVEEE